MPQDEIAKLKTVGSVSKLKEKFEQQSTPPTWEENPQDDSNPFLEIIRKAKRKLPNRFYTL
jgi:hypothetical protein